MLRVVHVVRQQRCNGHCDSVQAVETAIAQCTSRWAMARGHRLNTSIVLAAVHGLSGLFRAVSAVDPFNLSPPSHSVPVPNRPTRLCGRKATLNQILRTAGADGQSVDTMIIAVIFFVSFFLSFFLPFFPSFLASFCNRVYCIHVPGHDL